MNGRCVLLIGLAACVFSAAPAQAQEKGDIGLTISTPTAIGLIWHASPRVAVRPEVSFGFTETDGEGTGPDVSSRNVTISGSALFYTGRWDDLRTYVSPRFSYSWASTSIDISNLGDSTSDGWGLSGSIGAQYSLGRRFGVFAEAGVLYSSTHAVSPALNTSIERTTWTFGTRAALGGTLYF